MRALDEMLGESMGIFWQALEDYPSPNNPIHDTKVRHTQSCRLENVALSCLTAYLPY